MREPKKRVSQLLREIFPKEDRWTYSPSLRSWKSTSGILVETITTDNTEERTFRITYPSTQSYVDLADLEAMGKIRRNTYPVIPREDP